MLQMSTGLDNAALHFTCIHLILMIQLFEIFEDVLKGQLYSHSIEKKYKGVSVMPKGGCVK
jgi:hypothetical protein